MNAKILIGKGFLPEELPPPFNSELLGISLEDIKNEIDSYSKEIKKKYKMFLTHFLK